MIKVHCDFCNKELNDSEVPYYKEEIKMYRLKYDYVNRIEKNIMIPDDTFNYTYDLCEKCSNKVHKYIEKLRSKI